ncbi:MAG TPA: hypothetical protein VLX92_13450 [Kofleriaceae bacterium]|nr:hypothetical protein [Kofleriaceae bacterium]
MDDKLPVAKVLGDLPPVADSGAPPAEGATVIPTYALYSRGQIAVGTVLGGPLAGGWMMRTNWKRLGSPGKAWAALLATAAITAVLVMLAIAIDSMPPLVLPIAGAAATLGLAATQRELYARHVHAGGKTAGGGRVALVTVIAIVVAIGGAGGGYAGWFLLHMAPTVDFGNDHNVRYLEGGTEADARALGQAAQDLGYFMPDHPASLGVRRDHGHLVIEMVVNTKMVVGSSERELQLRQLASALSEKAFQGEPADVWVEDETYDVVEKLAVDR